MGLPCELKPILTPTLPLKGRGPRARTKEQACFSQEKLLRMVEWKMLRSR